MRIAMHFSSTSRSGASSRTSCSVRILNALSESREPKFEWGDEGGHAAYAEAADFFAAITSSERSPRARAEAHIGIGKEGRFAV